MARACAPTSPYCARTLAWPRSWHVQSPVVTPHRFLISMFRRIWYDMVSAYSLVGSAFSAPNQVDKGVSWRGCASLQTSALNRDGRVSSAGVHEEESCRCHNPARVVPADARF